MPAALTPAQLAARWQCSDRHIRDMIRDRRLPCIKLGPKTRRIPMSAVEEIERCASYSTEESGAPHGETKPATPAAPVSGPRIVVLPNGVSRT